MSYTTDSLPVSNGNGSLHILPSDMASPRKSKDRGRYMPCNCCPYGYHIDLDFVQYCEALSHGSEMSLSKQRRRERRRQRQSMEVLLGLTSPSVWNLEQQLPQIPQEELSSSPALPDAACTNAMVRDALHEAVLDFEETLQRSQPKPLANTMISESQGRYESDVCGFGTIRRTESLSSVSSMSAASGPATPGTVGGGGHVNSAPPDESAILQDFDVASVGSAASGLSTGTLQVQLSVLKEEKRQMLLQLRLEEAERKKNNSSEVEFFSERSGKNYEADTSRVRSQSCSEDTERNISRIPGFKSTTSCVRDVGVTCSVVTREVGVSPQRPKLCNAKTNTHSTLRRMSLSGVKIDEFLPDPSYNHISSLQRAKIFTVSQVNSINIESIPKTASTTSATNTDLVMDQVFSDVEMDECINKAIELHQKSFSSKFHPEQKRNFGVQVDKLPEIPPVLLIVERRDVAIQYEDNLHCKEAFSQTEDVSRRLVEVGVLARPRYFETGVEVKPKTRDVGISNSSVSDVECDKCNVKKRSIGVGNRYFSNPVSEDVSISLSNIGITQNKISDLSVSVKKDTRTIGCGTASNTLASQSTDTDDLNAVRSRDFGVNTAKRKLVDAAVGGEVDRRNSGAGVSVCDKCDVTIQNVAKNMLIQNRETNTPSPSVTVVVTSTTSSNLKTSPITTPSRIPRPASNTKNEKRRIQRQDTYTKVEVGAVNERGTAGLTPEKHRHETPATCPATKLLAMQASGSQERTEGFRAEHGPEMSGSEAEEGEGESPEEETHAVMDSGLFQPIQQETRKKTEPSKEMKAALKVLNDYPRKSPMSPVPHNLKNATNIVQQEWFKISSTANANPLDVEDYLDCFEEMSNSLLEYIVNMTDMSGNTAMHYAVSHGNFDVVSILLDSKVCNINRPNAAGYTCVMLVSLAQVRSETHRQVIRRLFQLADVNVRAKQHGQTALMLAVSHGRLDMVRLLVEAGADMNIQDEDGSTALMCAAEHGHTAIVKHLLSQPDCDASIVDCDGSTALNIAMDAGNKDIGVLLYAHEHFSRGSSPYTSLRHRRSKSATPTMLSSTTPPSPSPVRERVSRHEQAM
ncbi:KN motif and ankyrin repeat domain-containing protein 1-like isoform X2 [Periplaneta americana]|uniref:KN motif and ankyrin repeat domain-containing protein 1-like isoform X2 n=1 Tax=Periplaneta americana TaxID=6978 RepID=UPI0037E71C69